jgi:8-amino-7-oxononanoate synthase
VDIEVVSTESLERFCAAKLATLRDRGLHRTLVATDRHDDAIVVRSGRRLVSFGCNDYLGLSHHPAVIEASVRATREWGTGAGASRLISGNHALYAELEARLAELKGTDDAIVFGSGYLTSVGVIPALVGARDMILLDEHCHSCLRTGARLAGSEVVELGHNDTQGAEEILATSRRDYRRCLLLADGVYSMEGDLAPLRELSALAQAHDAWLMTDDAHGLGVVGGGRGSTFATNPPARVMLQMGTLSKAVGAYGGYLCASAAVCDFIRNRARSFVYSTGLPHATVAAAIAALDIVKNDPELVARPLARARAFTRALEMPPAASAIVPIIMNTNERVLAASAALENQGFYVPAIRPPTVPLGTSRLRFAFSAMHSEDHVLSVAEIIKPLLAGA